ncbi:hypothetical protein TKK_0011761 [Trichogramma kaykai]|uniref:Peptidase S1 domain-containing protein n=1 Tax=Trichogramma kaykai TaxID=54128 RepID=A0ABD2WQB6_9HYME
MYRPLPALLLIISAFAAMSPRLVDAKVFLDDTNMMKGRITGGDYAPITQAPYQAQIVQQGQTICGAAIISAEWLVSAAHCFGDTYGIYVITGSTFRGRGGRRHLIDRVIIHRNYDEVTNDHDICLVKLSTPIKFNEYQRPVPISKTPPKPGDTMIISGYGKVAERRGASPMLKIADVPIVDQATCAKRYINDPITNNMFCAGRGGNDACQGDSGGPGVIDDKLVGVVSSGMDCGSTFYPGIYTRVHRYAGWIQQHTGVAPKS